MRSIATFAILSATLTGTAAATSSIIVGCGSGSGGGTPVEGSDATTDVSTVDVTQTPDVAQQLDSGAGDVSNDQGVVLDSGSAADSDAAGISQALLDYPGQYANAYCQRLTTCCGDAGAFDLQHCINDHTTNAWSSPFPGARAFTTAAISFTTPKQARPASVRLGLSRAPSPRQRSGPA